MKPQTAYMLITPKGAPWLDIVNYRLKWTKEDAEIRTGKGWETLRREGFRVAKVRIEECK